MEEIRSIVIIRARNDRGGMHTMAQIIIINPQDNVAVALRDLKKGEILSLPDGRELSILSDVPYSHKVAMKDISEGADVIKYGECIGETKVFVLKGDWIHTHNLDIEQKKE
jgi:altronate hydrolase